MKWVAMTYMIVVFPPVACCRKEVLLRDADAAGGDWEWPNAANSREGLDPQQLQRGMRRKQRRPPPGAGGTDSAYEGSDSDSASSNGGRREYRNDSRPGGRGGVTSSTRGPHDAPF